MDDSSRPVIGVITARGGSKGVPHKNLQPLAGKPLIAWTIEAALASRKLDRLLVSTDSLAIADVARQWGAEAPFLRPCELAQDDSSHIDVIQHALDWLQQQQAIVPAYLVTLQPTSPLRSSEDIDAAVQLAQSGSAGAVVSVCASTQHPYLSKRMTARGTLVDFITANLPYLRRQDLPDAYYLNGAVYVTSPEVVRRHRTLCPPETLAYVMPESRSLDIDTVWDFQLAEFLLQPGGVRRSA